MLDRGEQLDWFGSGEIMDRGHRRRVGLLPVPRPHLHRATQPFVNPALFRDRNFAAGTLFIFIVGVMLSRLAGAADALSAEPDGLSGRHRRPGHGAARHRHDGRHDDRRPPDRQGRYAHAARRRPRAHRLGALRDDRLDARRVAVRRSSAIGFVQGAGLGFLFVPLSTVTFATLPPEHARPKAPASTTCRAISAPASAFRWSPAC